MEVPFKQEQKRLPLPHVSMCTCITHRHIYTQTSKMVRVYLSVELHGPKHAKKGCTLIGAFKLQRRQICTRTHAHARTLLQCTTPWPEMAPPPRPPRAPETPVPCPLSRVWLTLTWARACTRRPAWKGEETGRGYPLRWQHKWQHSRQQKWQCCRLAPNTAIFTPGHHTAQTGSKTGPKLSKLWGNGGQMRVKKKQNTAKRQRTKYPRGSFL